MVGGMTIGGLGRLVSGLGLLGSGVDRRLSRAGSLHERVRRRGEPGRRSVRQRQRSGLSVRLAVAAQLGERGIDILLRSHRSDEGQQREQREYQNCSHLASWY